MNVEAVNNFAEEIIALSADKGFTVQELRYAADIAKYMANQSLVGADCAERHKVRRESEDK